MLVVNDRADAAAPPLDAGSPAARAPAEVRRWREFLALLAQLGALLLVVRVYRIESEAFARMAALATAGFAAHYLLPLRWRLAFFVVLSLAGIALVLGPTNGAWVVAVGLALIGISHAPIHFYARVAILLAVGGALALPRWGVGAVPWSPAIWPILGSMFVFRLFSYLYDRRHGTEGAGPVQTLAYFFLLPNVCFTLFPIIDYKRFCRSYYEVERHQIYQVGVEWIWRGLVQLLLYRLIYFHLTLDSVEVSDLGGLALYVLSTFLLYVRLSGYFHIAIGILHLFGFNLPETHHRYLLASSFTDFWRRINIYWKDFMMKVFYYPAFFRLRRLGETRALVGATIATFVATWALHMVQWFWIRGSVFLEPNDIIFWAVFGVLVLANALSESRRGRAGIAVRNGRRLRDSIGLVLRTAGTLLVICVMWSFWTAESATDWALMFRSALVLPAWSAAQWSALAAALGLGGAIAVYGVWRGWGSGPWALSPQRSPATVIATSIALCLLGAPDVRPQLGAAAAWVDSLRLASGMVNRRDAENFQRGYYENLLEVSKFNDELWRMYEEIPADFVRSLARLGLSRPTGDELDYELVPHRSGRFAGALVETNRWGMRDKDYAQRPPPGTFRLALVGPSTAMGSGVEAHDTFEAVLEERLNSDAAAIRYEILNFGVAGYAPIQILYQVEKKVFAFEPHMLLYLAHSTNADSAAEQWVRMVQKNILPDEPFLQELKRRTGIHAGTGPNEARRRMKPYTRELLAWVYMRIVTACRAQGVTPVLVYLETPNERFETWRAPRRAEVLALARETGFTVIDLTGVYDGLAPSDIWIRENDSHANALGNRLIARRLYAQLRRLPPDPDTYLH